MKELISTDTREISINGLPLRCKLDVIIEPDFDGPDFDFGDEKENQRYLKRFHDGELLSVIVWVKAYAFHDSGFEVIGRDILGDCHIRSGHVFEDVSQIVDEHGMRDNALEQLSADVNNLIEQVKPYIK